MEPNFNMEISMQYSLKDLFNALPKTEEEKEPCPHCNHFMNHLVGQECGGQAVSLFECSHCKHREHRGGSASELYFEKLYLIRKYFHISKFYNQIKD